MHIKVRWIFAKSFNRKSRSRSSSINFVVLVVSQIHFKKKFGLIFCFKKKSILTARTKSFFFSENSSHCKLQTILRL